MEQNVYNVSEGKRAAFQLAHRKLFSVYLSKDSFPSFFLRGLCNRTAGGKGQLAVRNRLAVVVIFKALCGKGGNNVEGVVRNNHGAAELNADRLKKHIKRVVLQKGV